MSSRRSKRQYEYSDGTYIASSVGDAIPCDFDVLNVTLPAGTWTEVTFPEEALSVTFKVRTNEDLHMSKSESGTQYFIIPSGSSLSVGEMVGKGAGSRTTAWFRSAGGNILEFLYWK